MFLKKKKTPEKSTELPPIEDIKSFRITDGEDYMDEIFAYDIEVSRGFLRFPISKDEYEDAYWDVINALLSRGEHKFFVAVDEYSRYLGHVWLCLTVDTVDFVKTAYVYDIEVKVYGRGIGSVLLQKAEDWARDAGARKISLRVEKDNPAGEWYLRKGYSERAVIMEKPL